MEALLALSKLLLQTRAGKRKLCLYFLHPFLQEPLLVLAHAFGFLALDAAAQIIKRP
jgi:hypothetical protein